MHTNTDAAYADYQSGRARSLIAKTAPSDAACTFASPAAAECFFMGFAWEVGKIHGTSSLDRRLAARMVAEEFRPAGVSTLVANYICMGRDRVIPLLSTGISAAEKKRLLKKMEWKKSICDRTVGKALRQVESEDSSAVTKKEDAETKSPFRSIEQLSDVAFAPVFTTLSRGSRTPEDL
eukprot:GHVS01108936.1.p1 GENE.GHVS01108936.1~~GHVS01108936.1.p1  ORF type:complete len:179 (+),score=15.30 GHVS01108936.1:1-537(+)